MGLGEMGSGMRAIVRMLDASAVSFGWRREKGGEGFGGIQGFQPLESDGSRSWPRPDLACLPHPPNQAFKGFQGRVQAEVAVYLSKVEW